MELSAVIGRNQGHRLVVRASIGEAVPWISAAVLLALHRSTTHLSQELQAPQKRANHDTNRLSPIDIPSLHYS